MQREQTQKEWYKEYYLRTGSDRNDLRLNAGVLFQVLAAEKAFVCAMRRIQQDPAKAKVLDVGCGGGGNLFQLVRCGYSPANITGMDIQQDRVDEALRLYPSMTFIKRDAVEMGIADAVFDLVCEFTMFATLPDEEVSSRIAAEMVRVCKPGAYLLMLDWRTPKPGDAAYKALTKTRLKRFFNVGSETEIVGVYPGALVPPVGRFLSEYMPSLYFIMASLCPFLVGQVAYLLRKRV